MLFAAGFAGSFHCVGMCGGFACALGHDPRGQSATALRHLLYNSGRLTTYCFLGGLAGALGQVICTPHGTAVPMLSGSLDAAQQALAIVAGMLMIAMALQFFGLLPRLRHLAIGFGSSTLAASLRSLPGHADDGRRWPVSCASMAAARRVAGRQLHPAPWPRHPWPRHPALRGSH